MEDHKKRYAALFTVVNDDNLSFQAKGVYSFLSTLPKENQITGINSDIIIGFAELLKHNYLDILTPVPGFNTHINYKLKDIDLTKIYFRLYGEDI